MLRRAVSGMILTLLLIAMLTLVSNTTSIQSSGYIVIERDGSISPDTAPISTWDNITYFFTGNIYGSIFVLRSNIIVDGRGYTLQGSEYHGIIVDDSANNVMITNTRIKASASRYGIYLRSSSHHTIFRNMIYDAIEAIYITSSHSVVYENIITNSAEYGIRVLESFNSVYGNIIDNAGRGIQVDCNNTIVSGNTITNSGFGISCYGFFHTVSGNTITNSTDLAGIQLTRSFNTVSENTITNSYLYGIWLNSRWACNNTISGNIITNSANNGIGLDRSCNNTISENTIDISGTGVILGNGSLNIVSKNTLTTNSGGIVLHSSSSNNSVVGNNITNNYKGISIQGSNNNNSIYHNDFINNEHQVYDFSGSINVWDDGYPSGGNYWSDHISSDVYRGPHQNETGSDGICDAPYTINEINQDRYPFMTSSNSLSGSVSDGHEHMLEDVKVTLTWNGEDYVDHTDESGLFTFVLRDPTFHIGSATEGIINVTLTDEKSYIAILDGSADLNNPIYYRTNFTLTSAADLSRTIIPPDATGSVNVFDTNEITDINRLDDLSVIYYRTYQAVKFARNILGLALNHPSLPVKVQAYSATAGVFYRPSNCTINIDVTSSRWNDADTPDNREWHEFGHHIMTDSSIGGDNSLPIFTSTWRFALDLDNNGTRDTGFAENMPEYNHWGYVNPSTTDSWVEGFAEFASLMVAVTIDGQSQEQARVYSWQGGASNLENPYFAWLDEEFATAAILWDIYDNAQDSYNMTQAFGWQQHIGQHLILDDLISLSLEEIWGRLMTLDPTNLTGLHSAFAYLNTQDLDGDGINDLDEIFILHGVFVDSPPIRQYNGEEVGRAAYTEPQTSSTRMNLRGILAHPYNITTWIWREAHDNRTGKPPYPGSFIFLSVIKNETGQQTPNAGLYVEIVCDPPYGSQSHNYTVSLSELPRNVFITLPPLSSKAYIYAEKGGYQVSEPLIINSTFYWSSMAEPIDAVLNHTFYLQPIRDVAVIDVTPYKTVVEHKHSVDINVTIENQGVIYDETFNVTLCANTTKIQTKNVALANGTMTTVVFTWNTTGWTRGNYTISAYIEPVPNETNTEDNTYVDGIVSIPPIHDLAVTNVTSSKTVVGQGYSMFIDVIVENQGDYTETFNVTVIDEAVEIILPSSASTTLTFIWNTTGFAKGNYTIGATADAVLGEMDTADNTYVDGVVTVTIPGDVDGDFDVDIYDVVKMCMCYGYELGDPRYDVNCDIDGDGDIDIYDIVAMCNHYGESWQP